MVEMIYLWRGLIRCLSWVYMVVMVSLVICCLIWGINLVLWFFIFIIMLIVRILRLSGVDLLLNYIMCWSLMDYLEIVIWDLWSFGYCGIWLDCILWLVSLFFLLVCYGFLILYLILVRGGSLRLLWREVVRLYFMYNFWRWMESSGINCGWCGMIFLLMVERWSLWWGRSWNNG